jgi:tetratricopeptide (TPR) repeat protein
MTGTRNAYPLFPAPEVFILSVSSLLLSFFSLTASLAYEFCFALGIVSALTFSVLPAYRFASLGRVRPLLPADIRNAILSALLSLLFPLTIVLLSSLFWRRVCRLDVGLAWFALLPIISSLFGVACAIWATRIPRSPMGAMASSLAPVLAFSLLTIRDLAFDPPLFFFHPAFGYFAGPIYDEWVPITPEVITFRIWTLALIIWMVSFKRNGLILVLLISTLCFRPQLGWFASKEYIQGKLGSKLEQSGVRFYFDRQSLPIERASDLFHSITFRVQKIATTLGVDTTRMHPIDIYLYPSVDLKRRWTGTRYTAVGHPTQRSLHLYDSDPRSSLLTHELAHVLAASYGIPGLGLSYRAGLLEGLATALQGYRDSVSIHEWAVAMQKLKLLPEIRSIMDPLGFLRSAPARAYLASGSFCRWLMMTEGVPKFLQMYRGNTFEQVYGTSLTQLETNWKQFLARSTISEEALELGRQEFQGFGARSIFERPCPHDTADSLESARECYLRGDYEGARKKYVEALERSEGATGIGLQLANTDMKLKRLNDAPIELNSILNASPPLTLAWRARILLADIHLKKGDAKQALTELSEESLTTLEPTLRISVLARREMLTNQKLQLYAQLINDRSSYPNMILPPATPALLLHGALVAIEERQSPLALKLFAQAKEYAPGFETETRLKASAWAHEQARKPALAIAEYEQLLSIAKTEGSRLYALDQLQRLKVSSRYLPR